MRNVEDFVFLIQNTLYANRAGERGLRLLPARPMVFVASADRSTTSLVVPRPLPPAVECKSDLLQPQRSGGRGAGLR